MGQDVNGYKDQAGQDIPEKTGVVPDEDLQDAQGEKTGGQRGQEQEGGQDHSLENYGDSMPDHGVGAIQDYSDTTSDIARIND